MTTLELWIKRHHRRLAFGLFLQRAGEWLAAFLFVFGASVLTAKLFLPQFWPGVLWLGLAILPILVLSGRWASRVQFSRMEAVALLDRQLKGGGLVMSLAESDDPAWHDRLPKTPELWKRKLPKIHPVRFFRLIGWPAVFVLGALLIPTRNPHPTMGFSPAVGRQATRQLDTMVDLLEASHVLAPEESAELKAVIEMLSEETEHAPLTSERWETIDHMRKQLGEKLAADETTLAQANEAMSKLLEANGGDLENLLSENKVDLGKVAQVLKAMNDKGAIPELPAAFGPEFEDLLKLGQKPLASDPKIREQVLSQVQSLLQNRSLDLQMVRSQLDRTFAQMPSLSNGGPMDEGENESLRTSETGSRADGPAKWGKESEGRQEKFKQVVLPPGFLDNPTNQVAGVTPGTRTVRPSENVASELPTEFESATGREVRSRELRPRHRAVVKKYFQTETDSTPKEAN
jgi:hypothetical protein